MVLRTPSVLLVRVFLLWFPNFVLKVFLALLTPLVAVFWVRFKLGSKLVGAIVLGLGLGLRVLFKRWLTWMNDPLGLASHRLRE